MKCAMRNVESKFSVILLMPWTSKIINHFLNLKHYLIWRRPKASDDEKKVWSDLSDVDLCGCISVAELIMEIVQFFNWNVNECAGFKTAAEYNAFPIMTSRSLKARSVRFIPSSPFHCQQTDEDDRAVNGGSGWTWVVYHCLHLSK